MAYIDLYGRNPDPAAAFLYPSTQLPLPRAGRLYVELPSMANRIFGVPSTKRPSIDDTRVQLDPTSSWEYRSYNPSDNTPPAIGLGGLRRGRGMGGLGDDPTKGPIREFQSNFVDLAKDNPSLMWGGLIALTLVSLGAFKILGRAAGG